MLERIRWIESKKLKSLAYTIVKMTRGRHIRHTAEKVAKLIAMVVKTKKDSDEMKERLIKGVIYFGECVSQELKKIWNTEVTIDAK